MVNPDELLARRTRLSETKRALLDRRLRGEAPGRPVARTISPRRDAGPAPLSFAQQRLWFLDELMPGMDTYHLPASHRLRGPINVVALEAAINEIVRRHEVLRTTFQSIEGRPVQAIAPGLWLPLRVTDASDVDDWGAFLDRHAADVVHQPFDLARGPLLRCELVRFGHEDHVFFLTMHHIVTDGWSMGVFFRELAALYGAFAADRPSPLAELPLQYADFAVWQRQRAGEDEFHRQLSYWANRLRHAAPLDLPADHPRPPVQSYRGGRDYMALPSELAAGLRAAGQAGDATLYMTMLAAFKLLLFRYTGQKDITVGTAAAGRNYSELEGLIGFFVNTLVLRSDLSGDPRFTDLADRVRTAAVEAYSNQDVPFEMLVGALQPRRDLSRTPLFQVFFNMVSYVDDPMTLAGIEVEPLPASQTPSKFDLTLYVGERRSVITLSLVYNADLFEPERMAELLRQYQNLLWQIAENPAERISRYSLLTRAAAARLPSPYVPLPRAWEGAVQQWVAAHAQRAPERLAVADGPMFWTYGDLDALSGRVAEALVGHGISRGDVVAVYAERSARLVCALLGVLKAGAAFVILDSAYPAAVLIGRLRATRPSGWVDAGGSLPAAVEQFLDGVSLRCRLEIPAGPKDPAALARAQEAGAFQPAEIGFDDAAYVAFTSGTTGKPRGVLGTHGPLAHFLRWHTETFELRESDRFSMLSGLSHDPLLRDIFTPLWIGGAAYVPGRDDMTGPGRLAAWLRREGITVTHLTPAMAGVLNIGEDDAPLPSLRYAFFGADVLTRRDVARVLRYAPQATAVNFYGATETPQAMAHYIVPNRPEQNDLEGQDRIALGRGIDGAQLLVLNGARALAGTGELGEIYIRSPYLAVGYLGDDALTEELFPTNPFTGSRMDRMYRTGDLGRYRSDGAVDFAGRADDQVKIRGFRVEPKEVEAVLSRHAGVRQCCVVAHVELDGSPSLVAYIVAQDGTVPPRWDLYEFLRERVPEYMVPSKFGFLPALPLTANGKVDRRALPGPDAAGSAGASAPAMPGAELEQAITEMWSELLGISGVRPDDNFFAIGGHSLLATQLLWRIRQRFEVDLPVRRLFEHPTPAGLAEAIRHARCEGAQQEIPALERTARARQRGRSMAGWKEI